SCAPPTKAPSPCGRRRSPSRAAQRRWGSSAPGCSWSSGLYRASARWPPPSSTRPLRRRRSCRRAPSASSLVRMLYSKKRDASMKSLVKELIPHAPQMGLYVAPHIPQKLMRNALDDFASGVPEAEVLALYDSTLRGSGKDGAVFTAERFVFQNYALSQVHEVRYGDIVEVTRKKLFMRGHKVEIGVNRGRAMFHVALDFSGKPEAAPYIERFLEATMLRP